MLLSTSNAAPPPRRVSKDRQLARAAELAAGHFAVTPEALRRSGRGSGPASRARLVAMYLAHVSCSVKQADVAEFFGRDRRDVGYACRAVEELRDDPAFDAALLALEDALIRGSRR
jgi:chromosomal replication initiation ATPase DnaA